MKRRRVLQIVAALAGSGLGRGLEAGAAVWRGQGFGADLEISLSGGALAARDLAFVRAEIARIEAVFSLYDPRSELSRLNARGAGAGSDMLREVLALADQMHRETGGLFDATVQPLWRARQAGAQIGGPDWAAAERAVGWERVSLGAQIRLGAGQALTLNGLVQGYAADRISAYLRARGYGPMLVNMGEYRAYGASYRLEIADPLAGVLAAVTLEGGGLPALAVSSPEAVAGGHIFAPPHAGRARAPVWSTVAIWARGAALADGYATAAVLMERAALIGFLRARGARAAVVDRAGNFEML